MKNLVSTTALLCCLAMPMAAEPTKPVGPALPELTGMSEIANHTSRYPARWRMFFGFRICLGQVVNLPGETQCV